MTQSTTFTVFPSLAIGITSLIGQDNKTFLQGQLTCDLDLLSAQQSALGAHCDAKGKMLAILRLIQIDQAVLALQVADNVEPHIPSLKKYAVFSKVEITNTSTDYHCTGLSGNGALAWANALSEQKFSEQQDSINSDFGLITTCPLTVDNEPRLLIISTTQQHQALYQVLDTLDTTQQTQQAWSRLDNLSGTPQVGPLSQAQFVPQMLNMQMINGISFKKGCYIGQETVARMHYRGLNKRSMFIVSASSHIEVNVGDNLERQIGDNWRNAGTIVSVSATKDSTVLCAVLPSDIELDAAVRLKNDESGTSLTVSTPTYFEQ